MTVEKDKYIDPNGKARWGFGGSAENITVGPETVGETGGVDSARTESKETAARHNGGGDAQPKATSRAKKTEE